MAELTPAQTTTGEAFALCQEALFGTNQDNLLVHMWEDHKGTEATPDGLGHRFEEICSVLGVMANQLTATYDDTDYLLPTGFRSRTVSGVLYDGFATLATSAITRHAPKIWSGSTGLLLRNPDIVFAAPTDAWTLFYEQPKDIPSDAEWQEMMQYEVINSFCPARELLVADDQVRNNMAGKLAITSWYPGQLSPKSEKRWERLVAGQLPSRIDTRPRASDLLIDPFPPSTLQKGYDALRQMRDHELEIREEFGGQDIWSEVCVNARLQDVIGLLIRNDEAPLDDQPKDWSQVIASRPQLAESLRRAVVEIESVGVYQESAGISRAPAAVVYQEGNTAMPIVHFELTDTNIEQISEGQLEWR